ncbi:MAG: LON peptidase substrate-binding domain-containing protein [Roseiflexaceae bacterium]|nr:LON peptidase substrate-binding domain-containing protein [Roseiflexaceae bacterium]
MIEKLPLFPLGMVLFPNAPLPLHIFEERYRDMIGDCIEQNQPFGVVMLRAGVAESSDVSFHSIGTTAQIVDGIRMEDGRYVINTVGQRRFRIQELIQKLPYYIGSVDLLAEESAALIVEPANTLRDLYQRYWDTLAAATGIKPEVETLPDDPLDLAYWMAHKIQVENETKQRWLEADMTTRLREMSGALRAEMALLPNSPGGSREPGSWGGVGSWN